MAALADSISICVCTFKRPHSLKRLLESISQIKTGGLFTYDIIVVDNDKYESAKDVVVDFGLRANHQISYYVEPIQGIAYARNMAVKFAEGEYIAFLDDDEVPSEEWLLTLYKACQQYGVQGALGPVLPRFEEEPPRWVVKAGFYNRKRHPTGLIISWDKGRTGNVVFEKWITKDEENVFRPQFITDEDQDFFRRMISKGHKFVWCDEAIAYEIEPPSRWKRRIILQRAFLRGRISVRHPTYSSKDTLKSIIAIPGYAAMLPFLIIFGHHLFMKYLEKLVHHSGRIIALTGIKSSSEQYITS